MTYIILLKEHPFEDEETKEISGTIGQADTREECFATPVVDA